MMYEKTSTIFIISTKDALVQAVAAANKNTVVVVNSVGPIIMESWIDNANGLSIFIFTDKY